MTIKDVRFPFLTLLAPGGLVTMNAEHEFELLKSFSTSYTFSEIRNLMLDARVTLLDAKIVQIIICCFYNLIKDDIRQKRENNRTR